MKNAWMLRPFPNEKDAMQEFLNQNLLAVGWPELEDLTGKGWEQMEKELVKAYQLSGQSLGRAKATLDIIVNQMKIGDWILTPYGEDIHLGQVESDYQYVPEDKDKGYPHQRKIHWRNRVLRSDLSEKLRSSLRARSTAANLSKYTVEIQALAEGRPAPQTVKKQDTIPLIYPLRPDFMIRMEIPKDMSREESERLGTYIRTLYFKE